MSDIDHQLHKRVAGYTDAVSEGGELKATLREVIRRLVDQDATLSMCDGNVTVTTDATLTAEEREAIEWAVSAARNVDHPAEDPLRKLLERLT
jgi:hypothetical protein